MYLITVAGEDR